MVRGAELRKFVAPEFVFGIGARKLAGRYIHNFGVARVLLVSDAGVAAAGWCADMEDVLARTGLEFTVFTAVSPNPRDHEVMKGAELYQRTRCNGIVAIGGGSAIDCAKGIAVVAGNGGNILDYTGVDMIPKPMPPLVAIPTTAGTAADVSQFCIVLDTAERNKVALISKTIVPDVALIDPETTTTMDSFLTACTGMDALTHAIEALCSNAASPITDVHAEYAIRLVRDNLTNAIAAPQNLEFRSNMLLGCLEAGLAFSNASLGAVHAMAHSLGGYLDLPHGECNAILLSHVVSFNFSTATQQCRRIAALLGIDTAGMSIDGERIALCEGLEQMRIKVGITQRLGDLGVTSPVLPVLAEKALVDPCLVTNPRDAKIRDLEEIYANAI